MSRIVLVADDSMTIQRMATEMLTEQGLEVVTVANGVAAIKKLATVRPVMVLADVDMPGRDGYEVCDFVKRSAELGNVPVILAFSDADPFDQERVTAVRADAVVKKPFNRADLFARVEEFIGKEVLEQPIGAESSPTARAREPKTQEQFYTSAEFSFSERPAPYTQFAGIPEGAGLFEPEFSAGVPTESSAAPLAEAVPTFTAPTPDWQPEDSQHTGNARETKVSSSEELDHQTVLASAEPGAAELSLEAAAPSTGESLPSFVEVGFASRERANAPAMAPAAILSANESLSIFMANASAEIAGTFDKAETANPVASVAAQEMTHQPGAVEMQIIPQTEPVVESTPEKTSNQFSSEDYAAAGALPQPVEDTASRLGDWKLPETAQMEQGYAGIEEPVLAVLPDLTAELYHSPAQIEEAPDPQQAVEEIHSEAMVEPEIQDTEATAKPGKEELVASPALQPSVSSSSELETSTVKDEENTWAESAASVSDELELAFTSEAPLAQVADVKSWAGPQTPDSNGPSAAAGYGALIIPVEMDPAWTEPPAAASNELSSTSFSEAALAQVEEHKSWADPEGVAPIESSSTLVREGPVGQPDGCESWTAIPSISNELSSTPALEAPAARLEDDWPGEAFLGVMHAQVDSAPAQEPPGVGMEDEASREMPQSITRAEVVEESGPERELQSPSPSEPQVSTGASKEVTTFSTPASDASSSAAQEALLDKPEVNKFWEVPSEASLNEAFLEAALSSIGLLHARQSSEDVDQRGEPLAGPEEVASQFEAHDTPSSVEAPKTESASALDATAHRSINRSLVESIVQKVVVRMSPSALSPEMIEQVINELTGECLEDLESDPF